MNLKPDGQAAARRVLVVEDEYLIAQDIATALRQFGAEVVGPISNLNDALAVLDSGERIDVAVLDINVQGEMIFPAVEALRRRGVALVFATGYDRSAIPSVYDQVPRWEKPFDAESLARVVAGLDPPRRM